MFSICLKTPKWGRHKGKTRKCGCRYSHTGNRNISFTITNTYSRKLLTNNLAKSHFAMRRTNLWSLLLLFSVHDAKVLIILQTYYQDCFANFHFCIFVPQDDENGRKTKETAKFSKRKLSGFADANLWFRNAKVLL